MVTELDDIENTQPEPEIDTQVPAGDEDCEPQAADAGFLKLDRIKEAVGQFGGGGDLSARLRFAILREFSDELLALSVEKGFDEPIKTPTEILAHLMMIVGEAAEAHEFVRDPKQMSPGQVDTIDGKPEGFVVEIADVVIRCFTLCARMGIDLPRAIEVKLRYNRTRKKRHGGKRL